MTDQPISRDFSSPKANGIVPSTAPELRIGIEGFSYRDLHDPVRLAALDGVFVEGLKSADAETFGKFEAWRAGWETMDPLAASDAILSIAPHVERFVAKLFGVEESVASRAAEIRSDDPVFVFKRDFAKKRVLRPQAGKTWRGGDEAARRVSEVVFRALGEGRGSDAMEDEELRIARATLVVHELDDTARKVAKAGGATWTENHRARAAALRAALLADPQIRPEFSAVLDGEGDDADGALAMWIADAIEAYLAARMADPSDRARRWVSMQLPHKTNPEHLVELRRSRDSLPEEFVGPEDKRRTRVEPFALTDKRAPRRWINDQVDYCLYCHDRDKDSCSKGLRDKTGSLKKNALGVTLSGCPLFEKISEMHALRKGLVEAGAGSVIGALATAMIDNPMLAGTGHRICNDCMKACVYQTQDPVDIPQIETRVLTDVLTLPWGFEIWSFLTRWNPLNPKRPYPLPYNGKNILVVGLGPAGYTLCHHLVNEGFGVVGVDGLKIEPLPAPMIEAEFAPIHDVNVLREPLDKRVISGFGGVSEYGITIRWEKNFLNVLYLNLARRNTFEAFGGVRFGGTISLEDAWALGFDHVALASGAGKPTLVPMQNNLLRGVRKASDFLMGLQLTGAYKRESLANFQVRLPAVVIGGGLTAIDTATELLAYYVVQAERTLVRYETLAASAGEEAIRAKFDDEEKGILDEVLGHAREIRQERARAEKEGGKPQIPALLDRWGGVSIVYRRTLKDSPAYRLNHEEVAKSLEEGVRYVELMSPVAAQADAFGAVASVVFERQRQTPEGNLLGTGERVTLPARTVCVAAGTSPNTTYEQEYEHTFELGKGGYFKNYRAVRGDDGALALEPTADGSGFFTSYLREGKTVSYYGDNHPKYAGSVVKAMASAKDGYRHIASVFAPEVAKNQPSDQAERDVRWARFSRALADQLRAVVHDVRRLAPNIVEVVVRAPLAAKKFQPGQFYRLQNYERFARRALNTPLVMEGIALTGAWTDPDQGLLGTIVLEMGSSSRLCSMLRKGEPVVLMGPTGEPTLISGQTVLLAGGGLGNAVLFSIARAFKARGAKVIYFAGYRNSDSVFKRDEIEASTDQVIWANDSGPPIVPRRPQDRSFQGNIVQAMLAYERGDLGEKRIDLGEVDRLIAIGSDKMMAAVKDARHGALRPYLKGAHAAIGSINSPMQCMMKQICAQCLQRLVDPQTGKEEIVYTCANQDLELDRVDFGHLASRLRQNSMQEKLTSLWFERVVHEAGVPHI